MKVLWWIALILVFVGALNWGLVGIWGFDLVAYLFASIYWLAQVIYVLVALSGLYLFIAALSGKCVCKK